MIRVMQHFAPVFSARTWDGVPVLVVGALLTPGKRTVTSVLRVMGLSEERQFQRDHRVLNRAVWSSLRVSQILLALLVAALVPAGSPVVVAADETLERREGKKIKAHLSGCGSFEHEAQGHQCGVALGKHGLVGARALEPAGLGAALSDGAGSQPTKQRSEWQTA